MASLSRSDLEKGIYNVKFEKVDGSLRDMRCTLLSQYLPVVEETEEPKKVRAVNPNVLSVWDIDKNAWRSFRIDSVKEFTLVG